MFPERPFHELIRRVRAGDEQAATEVVRLYEPAIRRLVRIRLLDVRLRQRLDSMDICQSVMASFFVRAALGEYELNEPEQLLKLLATMARNKLADQARQQRAERRVAVTRQDERKLVAADPSPSQQAALKELVEKARRRLSPEERQLLSLREQGRGWEEIAAALGGSPEALRKRLARAVDWITQELELHERSHE